jgi:hypothetical protein
MAADREAKEHDAPNEPWSRLAHRVFGDAVGVYAEEAKSLKTIAAARHTVMNVSITVVADNDPDPGEITRLDLARLPGCGLGPSRVERCKYAAVGLSKRERHGCGCILCVFPRAVYPTNCPVYRQISHDRRTITNADDRVFTHSKKK